MSDYFTIAFNKKATLLDASNYDRNYFSLMTHHRKKLLEVANGKIDIGYDEPGGSVLLKKYIIEHELSLEGKNKKLGVVVNSGGSTGTIENIFRYLTKTTTNEKKEVIVPIPVYPEVIRSLTLKGLKPVFVNTDNEIKHQPKVQDILEKISNRTSAIFLTSPGNPYCTFIDSGEMEKIIKIASSKNILIILDAIFEEAGNKLPPQRFFGLTDYNRIVKIKGLSKDRPFMNDLRMGWCISPDNNIIKEMLLLSEISGFSVSVTDDLVACEDMRLRCILDSKGKERSDLLTNDVLTYSHELSQYFNTIEKGIDSVIDLLKRVSFTKNIYKPDAGNILFVEINDDTLYKHNIRNGDELFDYILKEAKIGITPGEVFYCNENTHGFRLTMSRDPDEFLKKMKVISEVLS